MTAHGKHIHLWKESGYEAFADGTFGNGGQNLYVSRAGMLQRIFRFDFNCDGYADLLFCNSHDQDERPPVYVCRDPLGAMKITELPTQGAYAAAVGDLNGDGFDELVVGHQCNGTHTDLTAYVYYGGAEGLSERYRIELPVPNCRAVAIGDFNGDGGPDLAFASDGRLRIFYQTGTGFLAKQFVDLDLEVTHLAAADLDGDGCAELYVRVRKQQPRVLWGGSDGINLQRHTLVGDADVAEEEVPGSTPNWSVFAEGWTPRVVRLNEAAHLFRPQGKQACFFPVLKDRHFGKSLKLDCEHAVSVAVGDINGDGRDDLVLAVCRDRNATESSWIYWGRKDGFANDNRTALPTISARDVAVADLNGDGCAEVIVCQGRTDVMNSTESLIFRGTSKGIVPDPVRIATHDATTALVARIERSTSPQIIFINHVTGCVTSDIPVYLYFGGPDGFSKERRAELTGWSAPDAQCCDFNDDGWPDILVSNCAENAPHLDPGSFLYWGGPDGFHADRKLVLPTIRAHGSAVGDFRRSGFLDLAVAGFCNTELLIFQGGPKGFDLENPQRIILDPNLKSYRPTKKVGWAELGGQSFDYSHPAWLLAADFNNDGWLDLFVSQVFGPRSLILWGGPGGFCMERCTWLSVEGSACAQAADLNGDGWLELIVGGHGAYSKRWKWDSSLTIYWGGPEGFREDRRTQLPVHTCNSLTVADFNNDGVLDIFATCYNSGRERDLDSYIYWGKPGGMYSAHNRTRLFCHSASGCVAADFNEDGWVDLAVANHKTHGNHAGQSFVWWNGPDGFSEKRITTLPTNGPHGMLPVDPGNIMDRSAEEYYISSGYEIPTGVHVTTIRWEANIQKKTWVKGQVRFAPTRGALSQARWQGPNAGAMWFENGQPAGCLDPSGRWIQYRLALGAINGGNSPRVRSVQVEFENDK
ncbi:MAG: hypothetical protein EXS18_00790 [Verrucomicrobiae bacterium]|nr:hypothetical protein [Verrucomicrobiae bacterium]